MDDEQIFSRIVSGLAESAPERLVAVFEYGAGLLESVRAADLELRGNQLASVLRRDGIERGDRVAIQMRNHPEFVYALVGLSRLGAIAVPVDPRAMGDQLRYYLNRVECRAAIVTDEVYAGEAAEDLAGAGVRCYWVSTPEGRELGLAPAGDRGLVEAFSGGEVPDSGHAVENPGDPWLLQYTSGTTGAAKPIVYTYLTMPHYRAVVGAYGYGPDDVPYTGLPLVHGNARGVTLLPSIFGLTDHSVLSRWFSASRLWEVCREHGCTTWSNLGGIATAVYAQPPSPADRDHNVRLVLSAGMPPALRQAFSERYGVTIRENYGTSEAGVLAIKEPNVGPSGSIGRPLGDRQLEILDDDDQVLPAGEIGEIAVRAVDDRSQLRYWGDEAATAARLRNGWLRTGDRGWRDEDGWLFFAHRGEEGGIRKFGDFVPVQLIERTLAELPDVEDVCVYGIDATTGAPGEKRVVAALVLRPGATLDPQAVLAYCAATLKRSARPDVLQLVDELPTTPTQKIQTAVLKRLLVERQDRVFHRDG